MKKQKESEQPKEAKHKTGGGDFEIVIKMKGEDGQIEHYDDLKEDEKEQKEDEGPGVIESENTLSMIQKQLGEDGGIAPPPKKKVTKKVVKKKVKKEVVDSETRFFNNYSENP